MKVTTVKQISGVSTIVTCDREVPDKEITARAKRHKEFSQ